MTLDWDYSELARWYAGRPAYSADALERALDAAGARAGMLACDVGAGTGNLTLPLLDRGLRVIAVEPNPAMRRTGVERLRDWRHLSWVSAVGETLGLATGRFDLVAFGSSFNVVDPERALSESRRLLRKGGGLLCVWNHRRLDDPLQGRIESVIRSSIPAWSYGSRREDPSGRLRASGLFDRIVEVEHEVVHRIATDRWIDTWRSHATLRRQAGEGFDSIVEAIRRVVATQAPDAREIEVPYTTRAWVARAVGDLAPDVA
jgi:SAM-dependent methyltransferase